MSQRSESDKNAKFPVDDAELRGFIHGLRKFETEPWKLADLRDRGQFGDVNQAELAPWRLKYVNRFITETYRQQDLILVKRSIRVAIVSLWVATGVGLIAIAVGLLGMSTKDTIFQQASCYFWNAFCG